MNNSRIYLSFHHLATCFGIVATYMELYTNISFKRTAISTAH